MPLIKRKFLIARHASDVLFVDRLFGKNHPIHASAFGADPDSFSNAILRVSGRVADNVLVQLTRATTAAGRGRDVLRLRKRHGLLIDEHVERGQRFLVDHFIIVDDVDHWHLDGCGPIVKLDVRVAAFQISLFGSESAENFRLALEDLTLQSATANDVAW